jgi:putative IMPACT (imprinted ancient) family translation regulator
MSRESKELEVQEAFQELQKLEAIQRDVLRRDGEISDSLELKLRDARARYEAVKETLENPIRK